MKKLIIPFAVCLFISACAGIVLKQEDIPGNYQKIANGDSVPFKWFFMENPKANEYLAKEIVRQHKGEMAQIVGETEYRNSGNTCLRFVGVVSLQQLANEAIAASGKYKDYSPYSFYVLKTPNSKQLFFVKKSDYAIYTYCLSNNLIVRRDERKYSWIFDESKYTSVYNVLNQSKTKNALLNNEGLSFQIVNGALFYSECHPANFYRGFIPRNYTYFRRENLFVKSESFAAFYNKFKPFISLRKTFVYAKPVPMGYMSEGIFYSFGDDFVFFGE